jgi:hypothetical protein
MIAEAGDRKRPKNTAYMLVASIIPQFLSEEKQFWMAPRNLLSQEELRLVSVSGFM